MAKGRDAHRARAEALQGLGKDLARRSGRACELCEQSGVALRAYEVPPEPEAPSLEQCVFICDDCQTQIQSPKRTQATYWRFLSKSMWHELPAVQVVALLMLQRLSGEDWAQELLDQAYFSEEVQAWAQSAEKHY